MITTELIHETHCKIAFSTKVKNMVIYINHAWHNENETFEDDNENCI